jgi:hypothetical protein
MPRLLSMILVTIAVVSFVYIFVNPTNRVTLDGEQFLQYQTDDNIAVVRQKIHATTSPAWAKILDKNGDLILIAINKAFTERYGLTEAQAVGKTDFEFNSNQRLAKKYVEDDWKVLNTGKAHDNIVEYVTSDGSHIIMRNVKYKIMFPDGSVGVAGMVIEYQL